MLTFGARGGGGDDGGVEIGVGDGDLEADPAVSASFGGGDDDMHLTEKAEFFLKEGS